jgi:plasmid stabilization system protein ParE
MPVRVVDIHPLAAQELRAAYRWYRRRGAASAPRFGAAVNGLFQRLATAAEQGSPYGHRYRWMRLGRFPYVVYYEIRDPQPVLIYAVAHARRRPGYWLRRGP